MLFKYEDCCMKVTDCYRLQSLFLLQHRPISYYDKSDFLIMLLKIKTETACLDGRPSFPGNKLH